ncbi:MAG TPA: NAD(P)-dependent oxidoreductase [Pyrinomonadaceae bacterium]|jgi:nucleoside-diphosphate-sugar epimerase|nr:NAD(P)-dependent oxidoreductase [Pyrinomonadaceae bacterium]
MITILGASGFIGSHLARKLATDGTDYRAIGRNDPIPDEDLGHVIYCIGVTADFRTRPLDTVEAHVCALIELIRRHQFESVVYLSSTRVYADDVSSNEDKPLHVRPGNAPDLYNISKAMGESIALNCAHRACVARLSNVYGPDFQSDNFLPSIVRDAVSGEKLVLHTAPESAKDYISIDDVVNVLIQIATRGREQIYNVASGVNVSHRELADKLRELTGCEVEFAANAPVARFPPIDIERVRSEFAFTPSSVLDDLPQLVESYKRALAK